MSVENYENIYKFVWHVSVGLETFGSFFLHLFLQSASQIMNWLLLCISVFTCRRAKNIDGKRKKKKNKSSKTRAYLFAEKMMENRKANRKKKTNKIGM